MKNLFLSLILLLSVCQYVLIAQNDDWQPMPGHGSSHPYYLLIKQDGNITYVIDSTLNTTKRKHFVTETRRCVAKNLSILHESELKDSLWIMLIPDRGEMYKMFETKRLSSTQREEAPGGDAMFCVYDSLHSPLNRELMLWMSVKAWGEIQDPRLFWLKEGLATYANPEADNCDGHTFEERYARFAQSGQLIDLVSFPQEEEGLAYKIGRHQSAYIVDYLLDNYETGKIKQLWQGRMTDFEEIFGITLEALTATIGTNLSEKYPTPVRFNQDEFNRDCIGPQPDDWFPAYNPTAFYLPVKDKMVTKEVGNLKFTLFSTLSLSERDEVITRTREHIAAHLALLNEPPFNDSIHLVLVPTGDEMVELLGGRIGGTAHMKEDGYAKENTIYVTHKGNHSALSHEIMHVVAHLKWGANRTMLWLDEGLATFSSPEGFNCDGHSFEERYVFFLQTDKLIPTDILTTNYMTESGLINSKISYCQSAYIVSYLIESYGIEKIKLLWMKGMPYFEEIYGLNVEDMIWKINDELNEKYPDPIDFDWERFAKRCSDAN